MTAIEPPQPDSPARTVWGTLGLTGLLWLTLINHLRVEWTINPQYSYGWGVPWLAFYLFWKRWPDRPSPAPSPNLRLPALLVLPLLAAVLPLRMLLEANPDWRLVSWLLAGLVVTLTLLLLHHTGGHPWLLHFAIPAAFILLAVPWPTPAEHILIRSLMHGVAGVTVDCVNWIGVPARQQGNLILLPNAAVGVDEACSGVRSFQSTLMAAVFLGEMYRFSSRRRVILVLGGVVLALVLNVARTFLLTWTMLRRGGDALDAIHDPAGYVVLLLAFGALWLLSVLLQRRGMLASAPGVAASDRGLPRFLPKPVLIALAAWLGLVAAFNEGWYRWHERGAERNLSWSVHWPSEGNGFLGQPIGEDVRLILRYDQGRSGLFLNDDGSQSLVYFLRWNPGRAAAQSARIHSPDLCLPSAGLRQVGTAGRMTLSQGPLQLAFRTYVYESAGRRWFVYYTLWEDRPALGSQQPEDLSRASRLRALWEGRRHLGQQVLEIAITGAPNAAVARQQLERYVRNWLRLDAAGT